MQFPLALRRRRLRLLRSFATCASGPATGSLDVLVVDHHKFTSEGPVFRTFVGSMVSCLIVGLAYRKNTNAKVERANGGIGDTLRSYADGRKDDWDRQLRFAEFAINKTASTDGLNPSSSTAARIRDCR